MIGVFKNVWIVMADVGNYSDSTGWVVAVFSSKRSADKHRELADAESRRLCDKYRGRVTEYDIRNDDNEDYPVVAASKYDDGFVEHGSGREPTYSVEEAKMFM
jgi:hypothetical protein